MEFRCEDFPQYGVVLVPPTSPEYDTLLLDIRQRLDHPAPGSPPLLDPMKPRIADEERPTSAILVNRGPRSIASIQQIWTFQEVGGRSYTSSLGGGANPSVLLPFGLKDSQLKLYGYWHVILPGSKRYLDSAGQQAGDNTDVRPPGPDELWKGGIIGGFGRGGRSRGPLEKITLTLDGVFFTDGAFAGANGQGLWDQVVSSAEAHQEAATIVRHGHDIGAPPDLIMNDLKAALGPVPDRLPFPPHSPKGGVSPEEYRAYARQRVAYEIFSARKGAGDERVVYMLLDWGTTTVPPFHKL